MYTYISIIILSIFAIVIAVANGFIAKQLEFMSYRDFKLGKYYKGLWHIHMGLTRATYSITLALFDWKLALTYLILDFTFYDAIIDLVRGRSFWRFTGTCEDWFGGVQFDWDCVILKIQNFIKLPITLVKIIIAIILLYFLWS